MPSLKTFAKETGLPPRRRWADVYPQIRELTDRAPDADSLVSLREAVASDTTTIGSNELLQACMDNYHVVRARYQGAQGFVNMDDEIKVVSQKMMDRILEETKIDEVVWTDIMDCNHISAMFVSRLRQLGLNNAGRIRNFLPEPDGHCWVVVLMQIDGTPKFRFIEPQTDQYVDDKMGTGSYQCAEALIVLG